MFVGVVRVDLYFRYATSLKDKRQVLKSIVQKLRNEGFSATECGHPDNIKQGVIGMSFTGNDYSSVERAIENAGRLFIGNFEVIKKDSDIFDYEDKGDEWVIPDEIP